MTATPSEGPTVEDLASFERLVRIESSLGHLLALKESEHASIRADMTEHRAQLQDHETRLRTLERTVWKAAGAAAVVGSVTGGGIGLAVYRVLGG